MNKVKTRKHLTSLHQVNHVIAQVDITMQNTGPEESAHTKFFVFYDWKQTI